MPYWDHNATTPLSAKVAALLREHFVDGAGGNASSVHAQGRAARAQLDGARRQLAARLGAEPKEVLFVSSGSEADALAVLGTFRARANPERRRLVVSAIEHPALLAAAADAEREGAEVTRIAPDADGRVDAARMIAALDERTWLCSLMWANNETGVLQPVAEVARACRQRGVLFHTDAVQAVGKVPVTLRECDADLLSLSGHKFGAPPGAAALILRRGVPLRPLVPGHQEGGRRGGTSNVAFARALAVAFDEAATGVDEKAAAMTALRDRFEGLLVERVPGAQVNGARAPRLCNTSSVTFARVDGEALLIALDLEGICVSTGAACASGSLTPSHVLTAMGLSSDQAQSTVRFSLGVETTAAEVDAVVEALARLVPACVRPGVSAA